MRGMSNHVSALAVAGRARWTGLIALLIAFVAACIPGVSAAAYSITGELSETPASHFIIGISIAVGTSAIQSVGLTLQRKSHIINELSPVEQRRAACRRPLWHMGFAIYLISNVTGYVCTVIAILSYY